MTHKAILFACVSNLVLGACSYSESKKSTLKMDVPIIKKEVIDLLYCFEIKRFPQVYSYVSEKLKPVGVKPLTKGEKFKYLSLETVPTEVTDVDFLVFAVNRISYEKATLIVYWVTESNEESFHERDQLVLVIYNEEGKAMDVLSKNLQDVFSTREFEFTSPTEFTIVDTDSEYSPDPESEAEDIKNDREPEPSITTSHYRVDPVKMEFKEVN